MLRRKIVKIAIIILVVIVSVSLYRFVAAKFHNKDDIVKIEKDAYVTKVAVVTAKPAMLSAERKIYGEIYVHNLNIIKSPITGFIKQVLVYEGQQIKAKQPLVKFDTQDLQIRYDEQLAVIQGVQAKLDELNTIYISDKKLLRVEEKLFALQQTNLTRQQKLLRSKTISPAVFEQAQTTLYQTKLLLINRQLKIDNFNNQINKLKSDIARERALLAKIKLDIDRSVVIADFDGVIDKISVDSSYHENIGNNLLTAFSFNHLVVRLNLANRYISLLQKNINNVQSFVYINDKSYRLNLRNFSSVSVPGSGVISVFFTFADKNMNKSNFILNNTVLVKIIFPAVKSVVLPLSSIHEHDNIFIVKGNKLQQVVVKVIGSQYKDGKEFLLVDAQNIPVGSKILTTILPQAVTGMKVSISNVR